MAVKVRKAEDYPTVMQIIEIEKGKYVIVGVINREQLNELGKLFEPLARQWRGQYQALAKAIVNAWNKIGD